MHSLPYIPEFNVYDFIIQIDVIVILIVWIIDFIIMLEFMEMRYIVREMCSICLYTAWYCQFTSFNFMRVFAFLQRL